MDGARAFRWWGKKKLNFHFPLPLLLFFVQKTTKTNQITILPGSFFVFFVTKKQQKCPIHPSVNLFILFFHVLKAFCVEKTQPPKKK